MSPHLIEKPLDNGTRWNVVNAVAKMQILVAGKPIFELTRERDRTIMQWLDSEISDWTFSDHLEWHHRRFEGRLKA